MLNENIKKYRKEKGFSQETLAQELNVVRQTVSKWEKGLSVPDAEMLTRIAEVLDVPVIMLLGGDAEKQTERAEISAIADQLYILNNQFAKELGRRKRVRKTVLIVLLTLFVIAPVLCLVVFVPQRRTAVETQELIVIETESEIFSEEKISAALDEVKRIFDTGWDGCHLLELGYAGDEFVRREAKIRNCDLDDIILIRTDFYVEKHGGDGSLNTDFTYTDWYFILKKTESGQWVELDHGYL